MAGFITQLYSPACSHLKWLQIPIFWACCFFVPLTHWPFSSSTKTKSRFHRLAALHHIYEPGELHFFLKTPSWKLATRVEYFIQWSIRWPWSTHTFYHRFLPLLYSLASPWNWLRSYVANQAPVEARWWERMWELARFEYSRVMHVWISAVFGNLAWSGSH